MGAKQTKETTTSPKANFTPEVEIVHEKTQNPHYGEVKVVKVNETEQVLILKEVVVNTKQAFDAEAEFLNNRVELSHPNVAQIVGYNTKDQQNFCSTYYKISIYVENLEETLQGQLEQRIDSQATFTETEILQVADSLVSGLSYFQSQGFSHGDIRPANIFVQGTTYKLSDPSLAAQKGQNGLTLAIIQGQKSYLAPELIAQVPKSDFEIKTDKYRADVFSLGLTLLSLATLSSVEEVYNFEEGTINETLINEKLEKIRFRYSPFTFDLIKSMLTFPEADRPDFVSLSNTLLPYQEHIRSGASLYLYSHSETVKRSALPGDYSSTEYTNNSNDDLEARIRAALERSEATFRAVAARDNAYNTELAKSYVADVNAGSAQPTTTTTTTYHVEAAQPTVAEQKKSQGNVQNDYATTTTYTTTTTTYNYTPATYNYTSSYTPYTPTNEQTAQPTEQKNSQTFLQKVEQAVENAYDHVTRGEEPKKEETVNVNVNA